MQFLFFYNSDIVSWWFKCAAQFYVIVWVRESTKMCSWCHVLLRLYPRVASLVLNSFQSSEFLTETVGMVCLYIFVIVGCRHVAQFIFSPVTSDSSSGHVTCLIWSNCNAKCNDKQWRGDKRRLQRWTVFTYKECDIVYELV